ncbi:hypothetical protein [Paludibaculum fermentans]|uniref:Uncharacterized protein n=1 Tax=Paludibaculum fermentans TaxID=1473598 RepID=A0A7S7NKU7_PALFE|nr:hypothetical protein [Paludibaculum fermentans]QOY85467.1 hypothetical protein IRI77_21855 [Paludibaculum fermentans]
MKSCLICLLFVPAALVFAQNAAADPSAILRRSLDRDRLNNVRAKDYTYTQRAEKRDLDSKGKVKNTESDTFDVIMIGERPYSRKIAHNDKPLSDREAAKAQQEFDKELKKRQDENPDQRRKRLAEEEKRRQESRAFLAEIPDAFQLTLAGTDWVDGHPAWIIDAQPRPGFKGKAKRWELLTKFKGRIWVDQAEYQWVRVEAETIAPVSFGWVLARLDPGAKLTFRQARINAEVWLPVYAVTHLDARLGLIKKLRADVEVTWKDYRKFQTDSRLLPAGESPDQSKP